MPPIARHPRVLNLAKELGLSTRGDCLVTIRRFALEHVRKILENAVVPVDSLGVFRRVLADKYRAKIEFLRCDEDVGTITATYCDFHPALGPQLEEDFILGTTEGITLQRESDDPHRPRYLAIVDARSERAARAYFTAWHEIAHLVLHPSQLAFKGFRRMPTLTEVKKDPIETVVDHVAGHLAFYEPLFRPLLDAAVSDHGLTFRAVEVARAAVEPPPSIFASAMAFLRLQSQPMLLVEAELALKRSEERFRISGQQMFDFAAPATAKLRAVKVVPNEPAGESELGIRPNMRIPQKSVLFQAFESPTEIDLTAREDQAWWEDSASGRLSQLPIIVNAVRRGRFVYGFITAIQTRRNRH